MITNIENFNEAYVRPDGEPRNPFDAMLQTDCTFVGLRQNVNVLVGNSKTGKTTVASHLAAIPLIGKKQYG